VAQSKTPQHGRTSTQAEVAYMPTSEMTTPLSQQAFMERSRGGELSRLVRRRVYVTSEGEESEGITD